MILAEAKGNLSPLTAQEIKAIMETGGAFSSESEVSVIPPGDHSARAAAIQKVRGDTHDYFAVVSGKHAQLIFPGNGRVISRKILDSPTNIYMVRRDLKALAKFRERTARSPEFDEPYGGLSVDKVIAWFRLHGKHVPFLPNKHVDVEYLRQNSPNLNRKLNPKRKLNEAWGNLQGLPKSVIKSIKSYNKSLWGSLGPAATYREYDLLTALRDVKADLDPRDDHFLVGLDSEGWTVVPWKAASYSEANYKTMRDVFAGIRSDHFYLITVPLKEKQRLTTRTRQKQGIDPLSGGTVDGTLARTYVKHTRTHTPFAGSLFHSDAKRVRVADLLKLSKQRNSEADNLEEAWNNFSVFPLEARQYLVNRHPSISTKSLVVELPRDEEGYVAAIMRLKDQYNTATIIGFNPVFRDIELFNFLSADALRKTKRHPYAIVANDRLHANRISRRVLDALASKPKEEDTGGISVKNLEMWRALTGRRVVPTLWGYPPLKNTKMPMANVIKTFPKPKAEDLKESWGTLGVIPEYVRKGVAQRLGNKIKAIQLHSAPTVSQLYDLTGAIPPIENDFDDTVVKAYILTVDPRRRILDSVTIHRWFNGRTVRKIEGAFKSGLLVFLVEPREAAQHHALQSKRFDNKSKASFGGISAKNVKMWKNMTQRQVAAPYDYGDILHGPKVIPVHTIRRMFPKPLKEAWNNYSIFPPGVRQYLVVNYPVVSTKSLVVKMPEDREEFIEAALKLQQKYPDRLILLVSLNKHITDISLYSRKSLELHEPFPYAVVATDDLHIQKREWRIAAKRKARDRGGISHHNLETWKRLTGRQHVDRYNLSMTGKVRMKDLIRAFPKPKAEDLKESWGELSGLPPKMRKDVATHVGTEAKLIRIKEIPTVEEFTRMVNSLPPSSTYVRYYLLTVNPRTGQVIHLDSYGNNIGKSDLSNIFAQLRRKRWVFIVGPEVQIHSKKRRDRQVRTIHPSPLSVSGISGRNVQTWARLTGRRMYINEPVTSLADRHYSVPTVQYMFPKDLRESWGNLKGLPKDVLAQIRRDNIEHSTRIGPSASYTEVNSSTVYGSVPPIGTNVRYYIYRGLGKWILQKWEGELHHGPNASLKTVRQLTGLPPGQSAYIVDVPSEEIDRIKKRRHAVRGRDPLLGGTISGDLARTYLNTAGKSIFSYTAEVLRRIPPTERVSWQQMLSISRGSRRNLDESWGNLKGLPKDVLSIPRTIKESWGELSILPQYARKEVAKRLGNKVKLIKVTKGMSGQDLKRAINTTFGNTDSMSPRFYLIRIDPASQLTNIASLYEDIETFRRFIKDYLRAGQLVYLADTPNVTAHTSSTWSRKKKNRERDRQYDGISLNNIEMWSKLTKRNAPPAFCPVGPSLSVPMVRKMFPKTLKESWGNLKSLPAGAIAAVKKYMIRHDDFIGPKSSCRRVSIDVPIETALDGLSRSDQHFFIGERQGGRWYVDEIGAWSPTQSFKEYYGYDHGDPIPAWVITIPRSERDRIINRRSAHSNREDHYTGGTVKAIHAKTYVHTAAANVDTVDAYHIRHMPFPENRRVLWQDLIGISKVRKSMRLQESWGMLNDLPQEVRKAVVEWTGTEAKSYRITADMTLKQIENIIESLPEHVPRFYIATMEKQDRVYNFTPPSGDVDFDVKHLSKETTRFPYVYLFEGGKVQAHMQRLYARERRAHVHISGTGGISIKNVGMWKKLTGRGTEKNDELTYLPAHTTAPVQTIRKLYPKR